ncbi:MAG: DUF389 domain-containing protein [Polyangiaceae bacterium]
MKNAPLARLLRLPPEFQSQTVRTMLQRHHTEAPSYWAQLLLAVGIATLGLVLNSVGVIIGAMLVAPLMGPIVELAMGLAVGSSLLALRSALRIVASVCVAVLLSGVATRLLPFQEVTGEIAARTSPTVLDLLVASLCALTAAFVTIKPLDTMSTAAGTSIGISLVPPLCAAGFGVGVRLWHVTRGALLLFTANFSAILLFAVIVFLLAGFSRVDAVALEQEVTSELDRKGLVVRLSARLNRLFGWRNAYAFKLLLPLMLVGAVFMPLQRALATVSTEVRTRQQIAAILGERPELRSALATGVDFDHGQLAVRVVVLGDPATASELQTYLRQRVTERIGGDAVVSVVGVPDAAAVARLAAAARPSAAQEQAPPPPKVLPLVDLTGRVTSALRTAFPTAEAGPLLRWSLDGSKDVPELRVTHLGEALGPAAVRLLGDALAAPLNGPVHVVDDFLSPAPRTFPEQASLATEIAVLRVRLATSPELRLCVEVPASPRRVGVAPQKKIDEVRSALSLPEGDVREGVAWSVRVANEPCNGPATKP